MASIYKRIKRKNEPYSIQYVDHLGRRRTVKGFTDKGLTEQPAAKLESEARLRTSGLIDPEQERLAVIKHGPLGEHLQTFETSLSDNSPKHIRLTMTRVRKIVMGCGFKTLADINAEAVQAYLRSSRNSAELGHKTYNHYLQAMDSFCNWCISSKRLLSNPLRGLERLNTALDVRHARRALTNDEVSRLIESAQSSGIRVQGYSGEQRARVYRLSYMTGLLKKELGSLTPPELCLGSHSPNRHRRSGLLKTSTKRCASTAS